jgi:hypothetical protein
LSYNNLSESGMTFDERRAEATRIVAMIEDYTEQMTAVERRFVMQIADESAPVSTKQLFWLRDLKSKYAE